jgi:voltage-gated potassium channel
MIMLFGVVPHYMAVDVVGDLRQRPLLRRALRPLGAFLIVVVVAVGGFSLLGRVGLVEAAFWLIDTTSIELHFATHEGPEMLTKAYAIFVRVALVVTGLWLGETVLTAAFDGQLQGEFRRMQQERKLADLADHVVVCGYGMFGRTVAGRLATTSRDVVIVEFDTSEAARAERDGHLVVTGDARRESVLQEAAVERASAVVTAIDDSNANIQIAMLTRQLAPSARVVVRIGEEVYEALARRAGADEVVIPEVASAERVVDTLGDRWLGDAPTAVTRPDEAPNESIDGRPN